MPKVIEAEMQLVPESDDSLEESKRNYSGRESHSSRTEDKAEKLTEKVLESRVPEKAHTKRKNTFLNSVDPIFYTTCLVCSGLLFIATYFFVDRSNRKIMSHLQEIENGNIQVSEKLMQSVLSVDSPTTLEHPLPQETNLDDKGFSVQVQSSEGDSATSVMASQVMDGQSKADTAEYVPLAAAKEDPLLATSSMLAQENMPSIVDSVDATESVTATEIDFQGVAQISTDSDSTILLSDIKEDVEIEIERLQSSLAEKAEQLEILALENYELRMQIEFGDSPSGSSDTVSAADRTVLKRPAAEELFHHRSLSNTDELPGTSSHPQPAIPKPAIPEPAIPEPAISESVNMEQSISVSAIDHFRQMLRLNPDNEVAFSDMLALATPDNDIAAELYTHASKASANRVVMYLLLGNHFAVLDQWAFANKSFLAATESSLRPSAEVLFNLAVSYEHLGRRELALQTYELVLGAADDARVDRSLVQNRIRELAL